MGETGVLIVGAGPTGLTLACELARQGAAVRVVDRNPDASHVSKALAVQARTLEVFDLMGVIDPVLEAGLRMTGGKMYLDGREAIELDMHPAGGHYPYAVDLSQADTERILAAHAEDLGVTIERGVELVAYAQDETGVTATLRGPGGEERLRAGYLAAGDGGRSFVRATEGIAFEGESLTELWSLIEARPNWDLSPDFWQLFGSRDGPFACFPFKDGQWRVMASVPPGEEGQRLPDPTPESMVALAQARKVPLRGLSDPVWSGYFRIQERLAARYRGGRAFLVGDAAHVHSPAGGQGMNTGIQDAQNLSWKLAAALAGRAAEGLLDTYEAERRPVAEAVLHRSGLLLRIATTTSPAVQAARKVLLPLVGHLPQVGARIADGISQVDLDYGASAIVAGSEGRFHGGPEPGHRAHDAELGDGRRVYDLLRDAGHVALAFGIDDLELPGATVRAVAAPAAREAYGLGDGDRAVYLVRPDGYVAYRGPAAGASAALALAVR